MKIEVLDGFMPERKHETDAGLDIRSAEACTLKAGEYKVVRAGFKIQLDPGHEAQVRTRSGLAANNQVIVLNSPGTIDEGYRGEVKVILANMGQVHFTIEKGDRIAQMVIAKYEKPEIKAGKILDKTDRGESGLGSTGV